MAFQARLCQHAQGQAGKTVCPCLAPGSLFWLLWPSCVGNVENVLRMVDMRSQPPLFPHPQIVLY